MNRDWPSEALEFEQSVQAALRQKGGVELARECESDPSRRESVVLPMIESLGLSEVDFRRGEVEAAASALGAKAAGRFVAPWPLVAQLVAPDSLEVEANAVFLVDGEPRRAEHLDLLSNAVAVDARDGTCRRLVADGPIDQMPLDPFGVPCHLGEQLPTPEDAVIGHTVLSAFWVLGALETSVSLATSYSVERHQFDRPIASFGGIQWRLADSTVARAELAEMCGFTLAKLIDGSVTLADAWALRLIMLESAESVMLDTHQIHGAIGLCEEHDIAVIDRHLQGALRRPLGRIATSSALADRVAEEGFDLLYPVAPRSANPV